jgi:hypothetical protein
MNNSTNPNTNPQNAVKPSQDAQKQGQDGQKGGIEQGSTQQRKADSNEPSKR